MNLYSSKYEYECNLPDDYWIYEIRFCLEFIFNGNDLSKMASEYSLNVSWLFVTHLLPAPSVLIPSDDWFD